MKIIRLFTVFFVIMLTANSALANSKYAGLVIDANSGSVIYQENANKYRYPASLTKMMTLYLTFDALRSGKLKINQRLHVSRRAALQPASKLGLKRGSTITVKDAILSLIVKSANDTATVLSEAIGGSEWQFARMMTSKARQLGMKKTTFRNASGLHDRKQRSTAYDMAKLAVALQRHHSRYYHLFKRTKFTYKGRTYRGHNRVTTSFKGADGLKTGYTRASGFNLVTSAKRSDTRLIGVVMGGKSWRTRDKHMKKILTSSFKKVGTSRGYVNIGKIMKKIPIPRFKNSNYAVLTPESKTRTIPHKPIATAARYSNSVRNKFMQNFNVIPVSKPYHDYKKSQKLYDMVRSRYAGDNAGNSSWN